MATANPSRFGLTSDTARRLAATIARCAVAARAASNITATRAWWRPAQPWAVAESNQPR